MVVKYGCCKVETKQSKFNKSTQSLFSQRASSKTLGTGVIYSLMTTYSLGQKNKLDKSNAIE